MRCISPLMVRSSGRRDFVPCGKCNFCLETKRVDWSFRLLQEQRVSERADFLTLTYDDDHLPFSDSGLVCLNKRDLQLFTKRLRKENALYCDWPLRYYSVGEYGTRLGRPHYHSIMFNLHERVASRITDIWGAGSTLVGTVEPGSIHYVTKYVVNRPGDYSGREPPFAMMSKRPGIGANYLGTHTKWHRADMRSYTKVNGITARLPRYYKDKIFTELERKKMALEAVSEGDVGYWKEVERLAAYHNNPEYYLDECVSQKHDAVRSKINSQNLF